MVRKYEFVVSVELLLMVCGGLFSTQTTGFVFPDLKALRTGHRVESRYKIAVLQEDPFLSVNGTGYVPELLRLIGDWYAETRDDDDTFQYDVIPVKTWTQLMTKASATHWQVSYGLIASSLLKHEEPWKSMKASISTVQTGPMMVTSKKVTRTTNGHGPTTSTSTNADPSTTPTISPASTTTTTISPASSTSSASATNGTIGPTFRPSNHEGSYHAGSRIDLNGASIVTLDGSPHEQLLEKSPRHRQLHIRTVPTNEEAISYIRRHPSVQFLKDSIAARALQRQHESELTTVCPKKSLFTGAQQQLYYGFFGRDQTIVHFLNGALRRLRTGEHDSIRALNSKYFGHVRTCPP